MTNFTISPFLSLEKKSQISQTFAKSWPFEINQLFATSRIPLFDVSLLNLKVYYLCTNQIKWSGRLDLARGPWIWHPWSTWSVNRVALNTQQKVSYYVLKRITYWWSVVIIFARWAATFRWKWDILWVLQPKNFDFLIKN